MKSKKAKVQEQNVVQEVSNGIDYSEYNMTFAEKVLYALIGGGCLFLVGYVFYQNVLISAVFSLLGLKYPSMRKKQIIKMRQKKLTLQFKDMLYSLSSAVGAGNSVERALSVTLEDMKQQYNDSEAFIIQELELMVMRAKMNRTVEEIFNDFASRSHVEDIQTFANIFEISKRTGGNLIEIIRNTTQVIADKIEIKTEIDTMLSGQQMEQKVMTVLPIGLIFFMTKTGGGFMDPIFTTLIGRVIATVALIIVLIGNIWSKKIADIQV